MKPKVRRGGNAMSGGSGGSVTRNLVRGLSNIWRGGQQKTKPKTVKPKK